MGRSRLFVQMWQQGDGRGRRRVPRGGGGRQTRSGRRGSAPGRRGEDDRKRPILLAGDLDRGRPPERAPDGAAAARAWRRRLDDPIRHRRAVAQGGRHPARARGRAPLSADADDAYVALTGAARLLTRESEVRRRWKDAYAPFFPTETDRANAAFLEVEARRLELWIRGVTPEPFGLQATTLERDASGAWRLRGSSMGDERQGL